MKTAVVLSVAVLANSLGNVCVGKGMKQFETAAGANAKGFVAIALHAVSNPWVVIGVMLLVIFLACYMAALSWADLSFVLPATAPGYILTAIFSRLFLQEAISPARWGGTVLIVVGTCLVARTYAAPGATRPGDARRGPVESCVALETEVSGEAQS